MLFLKLLLCSENIEILCEKYFYFVFYLGYDSKLACLLLLRNHFLPKLYIKYFSFNLITLGISRSFIAFYLFKYRIFCEVFISGLGKFFNFDWLLREEVLAIHLTLQNSCADGFSIVSEDRICLSLSAASSAELTISQVGSMYSKADSAFIAPYVRFFAKLWLNIQKFPFFKAQNLFKEFLLK